MKLRLSSRERQTIVLGGLLAVTLVWVYVAALIGPMIQDLRRLGQQVRSAQDEVRLLEAATASETALREQHRQVTQSVTALRKLLPAETELSRLIERLSELASQAHVKIQTIGPERESEEASQAPGRPGVHTDALITINAVTGYHQFGMFLSLMEAEAWPLEIASLRITADPKDARRHRVTLVLRAYFAVDEAPLAMKSQRSDRDPARS